jgi:hypothetical protein
MDGTTWISQLQATGGRVGGWWISDNSIGNQAGTWGLSSIGLRSDATSMDIAIWCGHDLTQTPPFCVLADGTVIITQLQVINPETQQVETVDLRKHFFTPASSVEVTSWSYTKSWQSPHLLLVKVTVKLSNNKTETHTFEIST